MVSSPSSLADAATTPQTAKSLQENLLTPRFYTTNFEVAANLDLTVQQTELEAMLAEMRADYNLSLIHI
jgi:magnesium-protoporphyrin IX monomethyl ester (oxidative) cyclase